MTEKLAYSVSDLTQILGLSRSVVYALVRRQDFPVIQIGKRKIVYRRALEEWLERGGNAMEGNER